MLSKLICPLLGYFLIFRLLIVFDGALVHLGTTIGLHGSYLWAFVSLYCLAELVASFLHICAQNCSFF